MPPASADEKIVLPLELIIFAEEEGTTFGFGMIGSRLWSGTEDPEKNRIVPEQSGSKLFRSWRGSRC